MVSASLLEAAKATASLTLALHPSVPPGFTHNVAADATAVSPPRATSITPINPPLNHLIHCFLSMTHLLDLIIVNCLITQRRPHPLPGPPLEGEGNLLGRCELRVTLP